MRSLLAIAAVFAAFFAVQLSADAAPLGRVVALGDSLASGQNLGPQAPGSPADCGRSTGGYPEVAMSRVTHGTWVNATCNATTTDNFQYGWTGPSGTTIPPQYDSLNGSESLVIVGSGNNEAFFGKIAYDCTGYQPAVDAFFHNRDYPQQTPWAIPNHCSDTYLVNGVNQIPSYIELSKTKITAALTRIHQLSPNAKIILVGKPRLAKPSGSQCFSSEMWLTATDAPLYATWEDGLEQGMIDTVNAFNASVPGNYARFVDMQAISGTSHTGCETSWSDRWMNPHTWQSGPQYPGIPLHHTQLGASVTANAIIDQIHAYGFDTGATVTNPVVSISSPASGILTTNATIPVSFTASDNIRIASCNITSGASVALSPGTNTIVVTCLDDAGNSGSASVTVKRDASPPVISISSPANGSGTTAASTQLVYSATDDVGTPNCTPVSGTTFTLSTGANTLSVSCTDSVGRNATAAITVYRGTPPVVAISAPADGTKTASAAINVAYTVNGAAAIPGGTSCNVNGSASGSATTNSAPLAIGVNSIVVDCTNLFGTGSSSIAVTRGNPPAIAITAPVDGLKTTAASVNVTYTVDGVASIPGGTSCTVNGSASASASSNSVAIALGANTITVACTNAFGSSSTAVTVTRGVPPVVAITAPSNGLNTAASSVNVSYTVDGVASVPGGTSCTVNGSSSASASSNSFALALGSNTITVACTNAFGSSSTAVAVTRGNPPAIAITAPVDGLKTTAASVNVTYTVDGVASVPGGTSCTVNGSASASASSNSVAIALGTNTITVACTNTFGNTSTAVTVTRGVPPVVAIVAPADNTVTSAASVNAVFSLNGVASIPGGTACNVNGVATTNTATNSVALEIGSNAITVTCSSAFGTGAATVTVVRGTGPSVAITAPGNGLSTTASSINVAFTVNGAASIPGGTTCNVNGAPAISAGTNTFALALGSNTIEVACSSALGDDTQSVVVFRGNPPAVAITAPSNGLNTAASSVNVSYTVDGVASIPGGTGCTVNGTASASASSNSVAIALGANTITVACTNAFGSNSTAVTVTGFVEPDVTAPLAPAVTRTSPSATPTSSTSQTVSYSGAEAGGSFQCKLDAGAYAACQASPYTVSGLAHGTHTISVTQTDSSGNVSPASTVTWAVDIIGPSAPTVTRTAPVGNPTPLSTQTITYSAAEAGGSLQCKLDSAAFSACSGSPVSLSGLADGTHSYTVVQTDSPGNVGSAATVTWVVDSLAPSAPIVTRTAPTASPTNSASQSIVYSGESNATFECALDGAAFAACPSSPVTLTNLSDGSHSYSVTQTDLSGNVSPPATVAWSVDTTPPSAPTVGRNNPTTTPTNSTSQTITYSGAEAGGSFQCKLDGAAYSPCSGSPFNLSGLAGGTHTVSVTHTDSAGNVSQPGSVTWTVDITAPSAPIVIRTSPTASPTNSTSQTITYSGEPGGTFQCRLDTAAYAPCTGSPVTISGLTDGTHTWSVTQTDAAGNLGSAATVTWIVDISAPSPPSVTRTSPTATVTNSTSQTFAFSGEPGGTFQCKLDAASYTACLSSPATLTALTEGPHSLSVTQTDALGNVGQPTTVTWTVDLTAPSAPSVTRTSPTANPTNSTSQSISYGGLEGGASAQCKLDNAAYGPCGASPLSLNGLSSGSHTYSVTQTDVAGNVSAPGSVSWVVDVTPPPTPNVSGPSGTTGLTFATITYGDAESGVSFRCKLDAAAYAPCASSPISLTGLASGPHTYYVTATDPAGNVSAAGTASWTVNPDVAGVSITSAPSSLSKNSAAAFTFVLSGPDAATFECKLDTGAFAACTSPANYSGLADGSHTFTVRAVNNGQTLAQDSRTWVIDATAPGAPTVTRVSPTTTPTNLTQQTLTIDTAEPGGVLNCAVNGPTYETCPSSPVILSDLGNASYELSVTQTDAAGNVSPPATVSWVVDTIAPAAPTVTRSSPSASPTSSTTQTISFAGEAGSSFECRLDAGLYAPCSASPVVLENLILGNHSFAVRQIDAAGNSSPAAAVAWTISDAVPPGPETPINPPDSPIVTEFSAKLSAVAPKSIKPALTGAPFSLKARGSVGSFRVTLSTAATVSVRLERIVAGASRASTTWKKFKLKAGQTTIYLSGRANNRALAAGTYKVHMTIGGANSNVFSKSFRVKR